APQPGKGVCRARAAGRTVACTAYHHHRNPPAGTALGTGSGLPDGTLMATDPPTPDPGSQAPSQAPSATSTWGTNRNLELAMLAFATVVVTTALVLVELNQEHELTRSLLYYGAAYLALFGAAHIAVRKLA